MPPLTAHSAPGSNRFKMLAFRLPNPQSESVSYPVPDADFSKKIRGLALRPQGSFKLTWENHPRKMKTFAHFEGF